MLVVNLTLAVSPCCGCWWFTIPIHFGFIHRLRKHIIHSLICNLQ